MGIYWELFSTFAKIGGMTFGGGAAMLPILQREVLDKKGWTTEEDLMDYYAIGQCTPGIIAVNTATFIGYQKKGIPGGIIATLGVVFPSLIIITVLAGLITSFSHLTVIQHAFAGIRACVVIQIFNAVIKLAKKSVVDGWTAAICIAVLLLSAALDVSPIVFVLAAAAMGILLQALRPSKREGGAA